MYSSAIEKRHNQFAPVWAIALVLLCFAGLATGVFNFRAVWKGYVLDMTGPAWNYILFRGLFTTYQSNRWTRFWNPVTTFSIFIGICFTIEIMQYFELYESTFDPMDFLAYISILFPLFLLDLRQSKGPIKS